MSDIMLIMLNSILNSEYARMESFLFLYPVIARANDFIRRVSSMSKHIQAN